MSYITITNNDYWIGVASLDQKHMHTILQRNGFNTTTIEANHLHEIFVRRLHFRLRGYCQTLLDNVDPLKTSIKVTEGNDVEGNLKFLDRLITSKYSCTVSDFWFSSFIEFEEIDCTFSAIFSKSHKKHSRKIPRDDLSRSCKKPTIRTSARAYKSDTIFVVCLQFSSDDNPGLSRISASYSVSEV